MIINIFIKQKKNKNMNIEKVYELFFPIFVCIRWVLQSIITLDIIPILTRKQI